ncbi:MAG: hypothetical protein GDA36_03145 [Rhodobacteraceae bacterium]|nr:hypothetical protein [Paracoccaceae bacterium]
MSHGIVTGYCQNALHCAAHLTEHADRTRAPRKGSDVTREIGVSAATRIDDKNHYGRFGRISLGVLLCLDAGRGEGLKCRAHS